MMDAGTFLLIILYILGAVLLVTLIILVIKMINTITRVNNMLDEVDKRITKFDRMFKIADIITDNMALISDKIVDGVSDFIRNIFSRKKRKEESIDE